MRLKIAILCLIVLAAAALPVFAQDEAVEPTVTPDPVEPLQTEIARLEALATEAARTSEEAQNNLAELADRTDNIFNLLGLWEAIGLVIGLLATGVGAAFTYLTRRSQVALKQAEEIREQYSEERETFMDEMRDQLNESGEAIRNDVLIKLEQNNQQLFTQMQNNRDQIERSRQSLEESLAEQRQQITDALLARSLLTLGERQYKANDFQGAINIYVSALEMDENNPITHYRLGYVYVHSDQLEKAEHHLERALEIYPQLAPAMAALGYTFRRKAEKMPEGMERIQTFNEAEGKLLAALKLSPSMIDDDGESWWGSLGGLYRRTGQIGEAIYAYEEAGKVTPKSSYPFSNLALLYMQRQEWEKMEQTYERVEVLAGDEIRADSSNYWAYNDLLTSRLAQRKIEESEEALRAVVNTVPADAIYAVESLINTLLRLQEGLGEERGAHITPFVERLRDHIANLQAAEPVGD